MGVEIERKFLVTGGGWRPLVRRTQLLRQGYLASHGSVTVRVRTIDDRQGLLTLKAGGHALERAEYEYDVPIADARELLALCDGPGIEKRRHLLDLAGGDWVVDEFLGRHAGLWLAEVELERADAPIELPDWLGREVTGDVAYYNSSLARMPGGGEI